MERMEGSTLFLLLTPTQHSFIGSVLFFSFDYFYLSLFSFSMSLSRFLLPVSALARRISVYPQHYHAYYNLPLSVTPSPLSLSFIHHGYDCQSTPKCIQHRRSCYFSVSFLLFFVFPIDHCHCASLSLITLSLFSKIHWHHTYIPAFQSITPNSQLPNPFIRSLHLQLIFDLSMTHRTPIIIHTFIYCRYIRKHPLSFGGLIHRKAINHFILFSYNFC